MNRDGSNDNYIIYSIVRRVLSFSRIEFETFVEKTRFK